jgi:hypothetical protein
MVARIHGYDVHTNETFDYTLEDIQSVSKVGDIVVIIYITSGETMTSSYNVKGTTFIDLKVI